MCGTDEVMVDGQCVADTCADTPCGTGTCTVTGEDTWQCECTDGSTGTSCATCADDCVNGTCDTDEVCICATGWDGPLCDTCATGFTGQNCDTCAANAYGPNCETCESLTTAEPWWDRNYGGRQALVVYNPPNAARSVLQGVAVEHSFPHDTLVVNGGADPDGIDLRVISPPDVDLDRILSFDSAWSQPDTRIWFPTVADIPAGQFDVYFLYSRNLQPATPRENAANVLRQDRGWYHGPGGPAYSPQPLNSGQYSIQLRQKNPSTLQVYFHDSGNDITAVAQLRLFDTTTGAQVQDLSYGSSRGSSAVPANVFDELTGLPNSMRVDVLINAGDGAAGETAAFFLGDQQVVSGTTTQTYQATLSRAVNATAAPNIVACPAEVVPP
jgi:hypothetical protein